MKTQLKSEPAQYCFCSLTRKECYNSWRSEIASRLGYKEKWITWGHPDSKEGRLRTKELGASPQITIRLSRPSEVGNLPYYRW